MQTEEIMLATITHVGSVRGLLARSFVYERDQHQTVCAAMLHEMRWPSEADLSGMRSEQAARDEQQRREDEAEEAYHRELELEMLAEEAERAWLDMADEQDDVDVDVCQCCGRFYGPHSKEKGWVPTPHSIMPQRCFRCWDI
jgi:hypothetical protein